MKADTGPIGGDLSHEFILLADTGESEVYCDKALIDMEVPGVDIDYESDLEPILQQWTSHYAATEEMHDADKFSKEVPDEKQRISARGIEVGHIFYFGTKYSEPMKCEVQGPDGKLIPLEMGSYGIGVSRLMGAIIEASNDENGIIWPTSVAPFDVGIILKPGDEQTDTMVEKLYSELGNLGIDCLMDDTNERAGGKFKTMDLIGLPVQMIIGPKGAKNGMVEVKDRKTGERSDMSIEQATALFK